MAGIAASVAPITSEDDEDICRICRMGGEEDNPLFYPCACSGSIKFVHQDCLLMWLKHSKKSHCEVCKHAFSFSPVYKPDAPHRLPFHELLLGLCLRAASGIRLFLRAYLVTVVWLMAVPYCTTWLWRLCFLRRLSDLPDLFANRLGAANFLSDCVVGACLSAGVVLLFVSLTSLREYLLQLQAANRHRRRRRGEDQGREIEVVDGRRGEGRGGRRGGGRVRWEGAGEGGEERHDDGHVPVERVRRGRGGGGDALDEFDDDDGDMEMFEDGLGLAAELDAFDEVGFDELIGLRGPLIRLLENSLTVLVSNLLFLAAICFVPFVVGRVTIHSCNSITLLLHSHIASQVQASRAATICPLPPSAPFPYSLLDQLLPPITSPLPPPYAPLPSSASNFKLSLVDSTKLKPSSSHGPFHHFLRTASSNSSTLLPPLSLPSNQTLIHHLVHSLTLSSSSLRLRYGELHQSFWSLLGPPLLTLLSPLALPDAPVEVSDVATLMVGYEMLGLSAIYLGFVVFLLQQRNVEQGGEDGEGILARLPLLLASMLNVAPAVWQQVAANVKHTLLVMKVSFLLLVELGLFPFLCGWWLDVCSLSLLQSSLTDRAAFSLSYPLLSSLLHWFVGILYMLQVSLFVSILREVLRPGVLSFLRDPTDPNYNPFRDLVEDPLPKHARRVLLSLVVYGNLVVLLVFVPIQLAQAVVPSMFPLNFRFSDPFTEIPADMLLFHLLVPLTIDRIRPRALVKRCLSLWFQTVAPLLGLHHFLLPPPPANQPGQPGPVPGLVPRAPHALVRLVPNQLPDQIAAEGLNRRVGMGPEAIGEARQGEQEREEEGVGRVGEEDAATRARAERRSFALRVSLLLCLAWLSFLLLNCCSIVLPTLAGRQVLSLLMHLPLSDTTTCNDLYAFGIGAYATWASVVGCRAAWRYLAHNSVPAALRLLCHWTAIIVKAAMLLTLWIGAIPLLLGLLLDLTVVMPTRVGLQETPVFFLYHDWALGLITLKLWTRLALLGHRLAGDPEWRDRLLRVQRDGLSNLNAVRTLKELILPILVILLTDLTLPFVVVRGVVPLLPVPPLVALAASRYAWAATCLMFASYSGVKFSWKYVVELHNAVRDDRYLVGQKLHNFKDGKPPPKEEAGTPKGSVGVPPPVKTVEVVMDDGEGGGTSSSETRIVPVNAQDVPCASSSLQIHEPVQVSEDLTKEHVVDKIAERKLGKRPMDQVQESPRAQKVNNRFGRKDKAVVIESEETARLKHEVRLAARMGAMLHEKDQQPQRGFGNVSPKAINKNAKGGLKVEDLKIHERQPQNMPWK